MNIAIDIANALQYLHHDCETPIVHCDLKPSNVLLDDEMTPRVGDFGLARFLLKHPQDSSTDQSSSIGVRGTMGYAALGEDLETGIDHAPNQSPRRSLKIGECLSLIMGIGVACSVEIPSEIMNIGDVVVELHLVRQKLLGT